jgi:hypothetical protein
MASSSSSTSSDINLPAEQLDTWAEIFFEAKCAGLVQVPLSVFLADPLGHIGGNYAALDAQEPVFEGESYLPLLPKQVEAAKRIQEKWTRDDARALAMQGKSLNSRPTRLKRHSWPCAEWDAEANNLSARAP